MRRGTLLGLAAGLVALLPMAGQADDFTASATLGHKIGDKYGWFLMGCHSEAPHHPSEVTMWRDTGRSSGIVRMRIGDLLWLNYPHPAPAKASVAKLTNIEVNTEATRCVVTFKIRKPD